MPNILTNWMEILPLSKTLDLNLQCKRKKIVFVGCSGVPNHFMNYLIQYHHPLNCWFPLLIWLGNFNFYCCYILSLLFPSLSLEISILLSFVPMFNTLLHISLYQYLPLVLSRYILLIINFQCQFILWSLFFHHRHHFHWLWFFWYLCSCWYFFHFCFFPFNFWFYDLFGLKVCNI